MAETKPETNEDANDYSRFDNISDSDDESDDNSGVPAAERIQQMGSAKVAGNEHIGKSNFELAANQYRKGLKIAKDFSKCVPAPNPSEHLEAKEIELSLHLNLSMAELKLEKWLPAKRAASEALKLDPKNVKALFRRGQANSKQGSLEEAKSDFVALLQIDPNNGAGKKEYASVKKRLIAHKETTKKGFGGIFDRAGGMYDDREQEQLLVKKKREEEEARLFKIYEEEMTTQENDFNAKQLEKEGVATEPETAVDGNETSETEAGVEKKEVEKEKEKETFKRVSFDQWKKDREKKQKEEEKEKEKVRDAEKAKQQAEKAKLAKEKALALKKKRAEEKGGVEDDDDDVLDEEDLKLVESIKKKGYCHFRREQTEEEKALIGNITPQKIVENNSNDPKAASSDAASKTVGNLPATSAFAPQRIDSVNSKPNTSSSGSVWNTCGTWEETDCSEWGKENIQKYLKQARASSGNEDIMDAPETVSKMLDSMDLKTKPGDEEGQLSKLAELAGAFAKVSCKITKVKKVEGDCSIAVVRGTKRYLFDLSAELDYEVLVDESFGMDASADSNEKARQAVYKGKLVLSDITHDPEALEVTVKPSTKINQKTHVDRVKNILDSMKRDLAKRCIPMFETDFHNNY